MAKKALDKRLDLMFYLKKLRTAETLTHLTLSKSHRKLIPYFNKNLLSLDPSFKKKNEFIDEKKEVKKLVRQAKESPLELNIVNELLPPDIDTV